MPLTPIGDVMIALKADASDLQKTMATGKESIGLVTGSFRALASTARNTGLALTAMGAIGAAAMFKLATSAEEVNNAYREVDTITDEITDSQAQFDDIINDINTSFGLQAGKLEVIEGLYQAVSAGVGESREEMRNFLETSAQLAAVGRVDLGTAVDVVSTAINAYGAEVMTANRAANALFRTVQFGKVRLEELAPVMGRVFALASDMQVPIEELGSAMALLTRMGFEARVAATGLRNIIRTFMKPSEDMKRVLNDIALEQDLWADNFGESEDIIRDYADEMRDLTSTIEDQEEAIKSHMDAQDDANAVVEDARLMQDAKELGRENEIMGDVHPIVARADSMKELDRIIKNYRFNADKAAIKERNLKESLEENKETLDELRNRYSDVVGSAGDLEDQVGVLFIKNEGLVGGMDLLNEKIQNTDVSLQDLFPRTRAMQAASALMGDGIDDLKKILEVLTADGLEAAKDATDELAEQSDEFTKEEAEDLKKALPDIAELHQDVHDDAQEHRDAMSKLREAFRKFGEIVREPVFNAISDFGEAMGRLAERVNKLPDSTKNAIGKFLTLAAAFALIAGPLLFFGGQLALIIGAMGASFIPLVAVAAVIVGGLASVFKDLTKTADDAKTPLHEVSQFGQSFGTSSQKAASSTEKLRSALDKLIGFVKHLKEVFVEELLGPIKTFTKGVRDALGAIARGFSEVRDGGGESFIRVLASAIGDLLTVVGQWLTENQKLISQIARLVAGVAKALLPPLWELVKAIGIVLIHAAKWIGRFAEMLGLVSENEDDMESFVNTVLKLAKWIGQAISGLAKFIKLLAPLLGLIVAVVVVVAALVKGFVFLARGLLGASGRARGVIEAMKGLMAKGGSLWTQLGRIVGMLSRFKKILSIVAVGLVGVGWAIGLVAVSILSKFTGAIAVGKRAVMAFKNAFVASVKFMVAFFTILPRAIIALMRNGTSGAKQVLRGFVGKTISMVTNLANAIVQLFAIILMGWAHGMSRWLDVMRKWLMLGLNLWHRVLGGIASWLGSNWLKRVTNKGFRAGKGIINAMVNGIRSKIDWLKSWVNHLAGMVDRHLPGSDADEGPLSNLTESGEAIPRTLAEGIGNEEGTLREKMMTAMELGNLTPQQRKRVSSMVGGTGRGSGTGPGVHIDEKAIYIAPGAFEGVSEADLPERVGDELEARFEEVLEDIKAEGRETPMR